MDDEDARCGDVEALERSNSRSSLLQRRAKYGVLFNLVSDLGLFMVGGGYCVVDYWLEGRRSIGFWLAGLIEKVSLEKV